MYVYIKREVFIFMDKEIIIDHLEKLKLISEDLLNRNIGDSCPVISLQGCFKKIARSYFQCSKKLVFIVEC